MRADFRPTLPLLCTALLLACSSDGGGPEPVATVTVSPAAATVEVGATQAFTAAARDANGDLLSGRTFTWSSTASGTVTVTSSGVATGVGPGGAMIRASTGGVTGSAQLTVTAPGPASVTITPDSADVAVGQAVQLAATVLDRNGDPVSASVSWSSASASIATVDGSGLVMGQAEGKTQITASAGGVQSAPATIVVVPPGNVSVTSITPDPMVEGMTATITGEGFSTNPVNNTVTINGFPALVTSASETQLVIDVPEECFPAGNVTLAISTPTGSSGAVPHAMQPAKPALSMAVGEFMLIQDPADFCLQFAPELLNEEYAFGVQSVSENVASLTPVRVRGQVPAGMGGVAVTAAMRPSAQGLGRAPTAPAIAGVGIGWRARHVDFMAAALKDARERWGVGAPSSAASRLASIPSGLSVGDTVDIKIPDINANFCTQFTAVRAVVRVVGARAVWLEQTTNPAGGLSASQYQQLAADFDATTFPTDTAYFGTPSDFDANGNIAVVVSREVNGTTALGFVSPFDFPQFGCPSSNGGEVFYMRSPDPGGQFGAPTTAQEIIEDGPDIIAHELVHIIQFGRRLDQLRAGFQDLWELESQATLGEEVVGWAFNGRGRHNNYGADVMFQTGLPDNTSWHAFGFGNLAVYYGFEDRDLPKIANAPEQCSFLDNINNGPCLSANLIYMPYVFLRWLNDHLAADAAGERALQRTLIDSDLAGYANIEQAAGEPIEDLLGQWSATLYADDRAVGLDARVSLPSWDLFSFEQGVVEQAMLAPRSFGFSAFSSDVSVRGGSTAYFVVSGLNRPHTAIRARSSTGSLLPGNGQMWIVRLQ